MDSIPSDKFPSVEDTTQNVDSGNQQTVLEARIVYLLLPKNVPVSRAARFQWFLDHINTVVTLPSVTKWNNTGEIEIISIIPREHCNNNKRNKFQITCRTDVKFVAHSYRIVYCLDMSPSHAAIDIQKREVLFDGIFNRFKNSIEGLSEKLNVPGNSQLFQPNIYLTIMVNTPFLTTPAQQVLVKGVEINNCNLNKICEVIHEKFIEIEGKVAEITYNLINDKCENNEKTGTFPRLSIILPDANFVNMIRFASSAITLLPDNSISHIKIITDGVLALPSSNILESLLLQLRHDCISVSFLKVGSTFHPNSSSGFISYTDLLHFFANSTSGTCIEATDMFVSRYHELFLLWSFHTEFHCNYGIYDDVNMWIPKNDMFSSHRRPNLLMKRQSEFKTNASIFISISMRFREGFTLDHISLVSGLMEIKMSIEWKQSIFIYYKITTPWPYTKGTTVLNQVFVEAPYDFLHDITCLMKKDTESTHRIDAIKRFWLKLSQLNGEDSLAQQLSTFPCANSWFNMPESAKRGVPIFSSNSSETENRISTTFTPNDASCPKFHNLWQPVCQLDRSNWRKWFHVHKITLVLKHDQPLPKTLYYNQTSRRYQFIQYRMAVTALHGYLVEWSSFTLVDNSTYVKLITKEPDQAPVSFCIIQGTFKLLPCVILHVAFMTPTSGHIRKEVLDQLKFDLTSLSHTTGSLRSKESTVCVVLEKPIIEKILVRYEPHSTVSIMDVAKSHSSIVSSLLTLFSRYLYHKRYTWGTSSLINHKLTDKALSWISNTLTKMRLEEGFCFAYSSAGIITMVMELWMEPFSSCLIQYVLFSINTSETWGESYSDDESGKNCDGNETQFVTEIWIEPQYGTVQTTNNKIKYLNNKNYREIPDAISKIDYQCINTLLTLEYLSNKCQDQNRTFALGSSTSLFNETILETKPSDESTCENIPFTFDPISILPCCQQVELLFSLFIERQSQDHTKANQLLMENLYDHLLILHDSELDLTKDESEKFTKHLIERNKIKHFTLCPINNDRTTPDGGPQWRCLLKGVSSTHVILTFIPASLDDLRNLTCTENVTCNDVNISNSLSLPIYIYDCPLEILMNAHVKHSDDHFAYGKDTHEDHRFKFSEICEDSIRMKEDEMKNEDNEHFEIAKSNVRMHCRAIVLAHSKSFAHSLYVALHFGAYVHSSDVLSAMDQCEESIMEIDITNYILTVCGHTKKTSCLENIDLNELKEKSGPCLELKPLHGLIRDNFLKIIRKFFDSVPTSDEFYYFRNALEKNEVEDEETDDVNSNNSENYDSNISHRKLERKFSAISTDTTGIDVNPLFLHLICTVRYNNGGNSNVPIRVLPTCLGELVENLDPDTLILNRSKLHISLDILCLTLPSKVQNVITEYSAKGLRSTSFCSDGFQPPSTDSPTSESSLAEMQNPEQSNLPEYQKKAIVHFRDEIKWLLKDEIAAALLDIESVTLTTLNTLVHHISHGIGRPTCDLKKIPLNFVFGTGESYDIFIEELTKLNLSPYQLCRDDDYYYLVKEIETNEHNLDRHAIHNKNSNSSEDEVFNADEKYEWLTSLDMKRKKFPNFWLIIKVNHDVDVYFHCRFSELPLTQVGKYLETLKTVCYAVRELCKRVNQSLLLQSLYETKICDSLLEPDDENWHNVPYNRLKSLEGRVENFENDESHLKFNIGEFSCPAVWQTNFMLHPRLKTGLGKTIISRGITALKNVLDKFSVSNRNNMFVYKDQSGHVFYLRLHENMLNDNEKLPSRSNEYESVLVSRSPSITSLPLSQKSILGRSDASLSSSISSDIRPRVRSFGEKEYKNNPNGDTLILKVHGITPAGQDIQCDLVQVLQNRLDDAVLEFLSITLARNAMCPLTPEDVHFIQKPFRPPEIVIRLTVEDFTLPYLESFVHYLKQNLLQFLNIPKYTEHYRFKDFPENDSRNCMSIEDNIFIYNQSTNPSSGNRGLACIALNLINNSVHSFNRTLKINFKENQFEITNRIIKPNEELPKVYLEFRLWKQGRVNIDNLTEKLKSTVRQSSWDMIMEYFILTETLCMDEETSKNVSPTVIEHLDLSKEIEFNVLPSSNCVKNVKLKAPSTKILTVPRIKKRNQIPPKRKTSRSIRFDSSIITENESNRLVFKPNIELDPFESGSRGVLSKTYSKYLPQWFECGVNLTVPSVKRHKVTYSNRHLVQIAVRELMNLIQDTPRAFQAVPMDSIKTETNDKYIAYTASSSVQKCIVISRNFEQWKATISCNESNTELLELVNPHTLKHTQKFVPLANNTFVPRQKFLWAFVESDGILIYTYNWTKEKIEKITTTCTNLGLWLSFRSCFLSSVTAQKLGLFHNQHLARKKFLSSNNQYACYIGHVDNMSELPKDVTRRSTSTNLARSLERFRDSFLNDEYVSNDIIVVLTEEMQQIKYREEKWNEEMKKLHSMYQSRTSSTTVPSILLLLQNSRIIHYCHTPLLFLPKWRIKSASTRDHGLYSTSSEFNSSSMSEETWHVELCYGFFCEYRRYLQTLGFMPLQIDNNIKPGLWTKDNSSHDSVFYVQKTILGGILLFTAEFIEPFFATKLYSIECNRLQNISTRASINRFTLSFLDECDRVKIYMHLHSFTYDYHLRCIHNYISNNSALNRICENYDINQFLDDFVKYYNKAPNFARNLIYEDSLTITDLLTEGNQLYSYLLQNVDNYNFTSLKLIKNNGQEEQIMVQVTTTSQVYYTDSQDCQHTDDFQVILIVHNLCYPYNLTDNVLHLKYYLILTSKRELYPALGNRDDKLGKFRTVSSASRNILGATRENEEYATTNSEKITLVESSDEEKKLVEKSDVQPLDVISTEEVNYLGYYSSHEQLMQQLMFEKAKTTRRCITEMVTKGMVHCRSNILWNRLFDCSLNYNEFIELINLANLKSLCDIHPTLGPLLSQPVSWYEGFSKLLLVKYNDNKRIFISPDGNIHHYVILQPSYYGAFMLLSMDVHMARGDLFAVYRNIGKYEDVEACRAYRKQLLDGFINCIAFYIWSGLI